ncbi:MAG: chromate reductase [Planctomycetota bacterium]|jgi:chromate reductase
MSKVLVLVASVGKNVELGKTLAEVATEHGADCETINIVDLDLPLYSSRAEESGIPEAAVQVAEKMCAARGLIVVAPEYNGSMPPTLNNLIAWVSRSGNEDWRQAFNAKVTAIATFSGGGGASALAAMRSQFAYLGANVIGRQIESNFKKPANLDSVAAIVRQLLELTS